MCICITTTEPAYTIESNTQTKTHNKSAHISKAQTQQISTHTQEKDRQTPYEHSYNQDTYRDPSNNRYRDRRTFCGSAGQPRGLALCGDQIRRTSTLPKRNTSRGLRGKEATEERRQKRTDKRRKARRIKRSKGGTKIVLPRAANKSKHEKTKYEKGKVQTNKTTNLEFEPATAQEPRRRKLRMTLGQKI